MITNRQSTRGKGVVTKLLVGAVMIVGSAGSVYAAVADNNNGAKATSAGDTLTIEDTEDDNYDAYANWDNSLSNRVQTDGGVGSTSSVDVDGGFANFRACIDQGQLSLIDHCSGWVAND